jgi:GntR family transcriptional regulator
MLAFVAGRAALSPIGSDQYRTKHKLLRDQLAELVRELPAGASLPTERELSLRYGVSRGTVRHALAQLEAEQRISRHQGRGTFVAAPKIDQLLELRSHTEDIRSRGMEPSSRLIGVARAPAGPDVAAMLGLQEGDEVISVERARLADAEPVALEVLFLDARRFDGVAAVLGESQSFYELLRSRYGVELAWAEETIEAVAAPDREAALLGVPAGRPLLLLCRQSFDAAARPVEFVRSYYRADRFRFRTRLARPAGAAGPALPAGMRLRLGSPADAPGLAKVFVSAWRAGYVGIVDQAVLDGLNEAEVADWLGRLTGSGGPTTWVVESAAGEVVGFSRHGEDPADGRRGHIFSLYVAPWAGGQGIAKALLGHDFRVLEERGFATATLWVFEANKVARALYERFGFAPDGARRVEPEYGAQEIRMRARLASAKRDRSPVPLPV